MQTFRALLGLIIIGGWTYLSAMETPTGIDTVEELEAHTAAVVQHGEADSAVAYNDFVIGLQIRIAQAIRSVESTSDPELRSQRLASAQDTISTCVTALQDVMPYAESKAFRDAVLTQPKSINGILMCSFFVWTA